MQSDLPIKMEQNSSETDLLQSNFTGKEPEGEVSLVKVGLILVFIFWATFGFAWLAISSSQKGFKPKLPDTQSIEKLSAFTQGAQSVGRVLGLASRWDTKSALSYLDSSKTKVFIPESTGILVTTYSLTQKGSDNSETYTMSSEYGLKEDKSYISITSLNGKSSQYIVDGTETLARNSTLQKWSVDPQLEANEFETDDSAGAAILRDLNTLLSNKTPSFKGVEEKDGEEILQFSFNIDENFYNNYLADDEEQFFSEMHIDFWVNSQTNKIEKIQIITRNLFIDEDQYTSKKLFEYVKSTMSKEELRLIIPKNTDRSEVESEADLTGVILDIFQLR